MSMKGMAYPKIIMTSQDCVPVPDTSMNFADADTSGVCSSEYLNEYPPLGTDSVQLDPATL